MNRLDLHELLCSVLGSRNVYFQPPENLQLKFPCIVYELSNYRTLFANNDDYISGKDYSLTFITKDPDSDIPDKLVKLRYCGFNRYFVSDNFNHYIFTIHI